MSNKYDEIMKNLSVSDDMRERILQNIENIDLNEVPDLTEDMDDFDFDDVSESVSETECETEETPIIDIRSHRKPVGRSAHTGNQAGRSVRTGKRIGGSGYTGERLGNAEAEPSLITRFPHWKRLLATAACAAVVLTGLAVGRGGLGPDTGGAGAGTEVAAVDDGTEGTGEDVSSGLNEEDVSEHSSDSDLNSSSDSENESDSTPSADNSGDSSDSTDSDSLTGADSSTYTTGDGSSYSADTDSSSAWGTGSGTGSLGNGTSGQTVSGGSTAGSENGTLGSGYDTSGESGSNSGNAGSGADSSSSGKNNASSGKGNSTSDKDSSSSGKGNTSSGKDNSDSGSGSSSSDTDGTSADNVNEGGGGMVTANPPVENETGWIVGDTMDGSGNSDEDYWDMTAMPNFPEYDTSEALAEAVGFSIEGLNNLPFAVDSVAYSSIDDRIAVVDYNGKNGELLTWRKSVGVEDNSGVSFEKNAVTKTVTVGNQTVTLTGEKKNAYTVAVWTDGTYSYSVYASPGSGYTKAQWKEILS